MSILKSYDCNLPSKLDLALQVASFHLMQIPSQRSETSSKLSKENSMRIKRTFSDSSITL